MAVNRQELMSGTEAPPQHLVLDLDRLNEYLSGRLAAFGTAVEAVKFKGGQSNPTYRLTGTEGVVVLRRKPPGKLVASAHDIEREYRLLKGVHAGGLPAPRPYLYCADASVIGSEFYIVEFIDGRVFWEADMPGVSAPDRASIYDSMNAALAKLHASDPGALGLADLSRTQGYLARNFARWSGIYRQAEMAPIAEMDELIERLPEVLPHDGRTTLIHGDYGLYNVIVDATAPSVRAILDWEMATLGDPLVDLAHHLRAWWDIPDPEGGAATSLLGLDLATLGIPKCEDYVERYCQRRGIAEPDMRIYLAYAQFRYAAMMQGILKRAHDGTASSRRLLHRPERVVAVARLALDTLKEGYGPWRP